jgi:hypothetical protein
MVAALEGFPFGTVGKVPATDRNKTETAITVPFMFGKTLTAR